MWQVKVHFSVLLVDSADFHIVAGEQILQTVGKHMYIYVLTF